MATEKEFLRVANETVNEILIPPLTSIVNGYLQGSAIRELSRNAYCGTGGTDSFVYAMALYNGDWCEKDVKEAKRWFWRGAQENHAESQYDVCHLKRT
jgi:TPR repeat protein